MLTLFSGITAANLIQSETHISLNPFRNHTELANCTQGLFRWELRDKVAFEFNPAQVRCVFNTSPCLCTCFTIKEKQKRTLQENTKNKSFYSSAIYSSFQTCFPTFYSSYFFILFSSAPFCRHCGDDGTSYQTDCFNSSILCPIFILGNTRMLLIFTAPHKDKLWNSNKQAHTKLECDTMYLSRKAKESNRRKGKASQRWEQLLTRLICGQIYLSRLTKRFFTLQILTVSRT